MRPDKVKQRILSITTSFMSLYFMDSFHADRKPVSLFDSCVYSENDVIRYCSIRSRGDKQHARTARREQMGQGEQRKRPANQADYSCRKHVRPPSCLGGAVIMFLRNTVCRQPHSYFSPAVYVLPFNTHSYEWNNRPNVVPPNGIPLPNSHQSNGFFSRDHFFLLFLVRIQALSH